MSITEDTVRQIEDGQVQNLKDVNIDDVYEYEDKIRRKTPLDLYDLWERLNWRVQDLDFTVDKEHWDNMFDFMKEELFRTFTLFFIGEQAVTETLSPLLHAAPTDDDQIFLATQVVDEARHTVFFKKFFEDVLGVGGGLGGAFEYLGPHKVEGFKQIFDNQLVEAVDRVRMNPTDRVAWVRGITIYHLVVEGMLALTGQKFLLRIFREMQLMPGFRAGFTAVARDESRHVNYGVGTLQKEVAQDPKMAGEISETVLGILQAAVKTIEPADRPYAEGINHPNDLPPQLRLNPREVYGFSLDSLTKRLRVTGLSAEACQNVNDKGWEHYMAQIEGYEKRFDREHSIRYFDRGEVELVAS